ncbi:MAG: helix-turn-helix transcriptional regulator [Candidatus Sulfotelmatobacter sp.]|jgi:transcriptional regulator with XRE-family HTH domain
MVTFARRVEDEDKRSRRNLREKLRLARNEAKLSQAVVAYMCGCTQSYLSKVERTGRVDFVRLQRLAAVYAKPLEWFQTLDDPFSGEERFYLGWALEDWEQLEKLRHWLVPKGWGRQMARIFGYVGAYMASPQYKRLLAGESFSSVFSSVLTPEKPPNFSSNEKKEPTD